MIEECWPEQEDKIAAYCSVCGCEIYEYDSEAYENIYGDTYCCKDCALVGADISPVDWQQYELNKEACDE